MMCKLIRCFRGLFVCKRPPPPSKGKTGNGGSSMKFFSQKDKDAPPFGKNDGNNAERQSRRFIAVASSAAAEDAVTAVVKFTSTENMTGGGDRKEFAAVKIQAAFRAYLARRALVALKGLVKLQALVRGNIVRKQTAETFRCMQALIRVQAHACACRAIQSEGIHLNSQAESGPNTLKRDELVRANAYMLSRSSTLKRNPSSHPATTSNCSAKATPIEDEKKAKILEIDPGKPLHSKRSKRRIKYQHSCSPVTSDHTQSSTTVPDTSSKDSSIAQQFSNPENYSVRNSTQFFSALSSRVQSSIRGPSPGKRESSRRFYSEFSDHPRYMANTESYKAKVVRSQSAPKQRPEFDKTGLFRRHSENRSSSKFNKNAYIGSGRLDLDELGMSFL